MATSLTTAAVRRSLQGKTLVHNLKVAGHFDLRQFNCQSNLPLFPACNVSDGVSGGDGLWDLAGCA